MTAAERGVAGADVPRDPIERSEWLLRAATADRPGGEDRPPQRAMARLVAEAATTRTPLVVQAGTGTGKSLAYLCGALAAEARTVVSTATRQLSDQLVEVDLPCVLAAAGSTDRRTRVGAVLKGRSNYVCWAKVEEIKALDRRAPAASAPAPVELDLGLPAAPAVDAAPRAPRTATALGRDPRATRDLLAWIAGEPRSGDRTDGPAVPDQVWAQVSATSAECPGAQACPFSDRCYAEAARAEARAAHVVVVNHALLALDLASPAPLFEDRDLVIIDEVHELERYLSSAWGTEVSAESVDRAVGGASRRLPAGDAESARLAREAGADAAAVLAALRMSEPARVRGALPSEVDGPLQSLQLHARQLADRIDELAERAEPEAATALVPARGMLSELADAAGVVRTDDADVVRWFERRTDDEVSRLVAAPLVVGPKFRRLIGERGLVATSATATVGGAFDRVASVLGLAAAPAGGDDEVPAEWQGVDVGSPFDYGRQAILYVPRRIPEPIGRERAEHSRAVLAELAEIVRAAGGRTLALFTTAAGAKGAAVALRLEFPRLTVLGHGDLSAVDLAEEFAADETSVLCATMGMWSGLDVAGPACTAVVIDKIPFPPMDDPLCEARREAADQAGGDGFGDVFVSRAALMLTQGVGRLIRSRTDRGLVAVLDPRLHTKRYGRLLLDSLPPMWRTDDPELAHAALRRLVAG